MDTEFSLQPIGIIINRQELCRVEVDANYKDALLGLEHYSHIDVFYWLHENDTTAGRAVLRVHPRGDSANPLSGVFATRSPLRPNPIAVSRCRVQAVAGRIIEIEAIDARDQSPLIDIKGHIPFQDAVGDVIVPDWVANK